MFELMVPRRTRGAVLPGQREVRSLDSLFDEFWRGFPGAASGLPGFSPRVDVRDTDEAIVVRAELPGLEEKDFSVDLEDEVLTIKGEKRTESEEERAGYRHVETRSGAFERRLRVPAPVDPDAVTAEYRNGVLTVTLPKPPEARPQTRTIPITSS